MDLGAIQKSKDSVLYLSKILPRLLNLRPCLVAAPIGTIIYRNSRLMPEIIFLISFEDQVDVFPSLQRPKKISVVCSDGSKRFFLCKSKDDLRKDCRFLELATAANTLSKTTKIKTYAVVPLNEDTGIIEWISEMASLRRVLSRQYSLAKLSINFPDFVDLQKAPGFALQFSEIVTKKYISLYCSLAFRFPPMLYKWFYDQFAIPKLWISSRNSFTSTTAMISIFGHILGYSCQEIANNVFRLGDRHCENILIAENDGQVMHVDFSCLFDKVNLLIVIH